MAIQETPEPAGDVRWIWVSLPWATFALVAQDGKIVDGPPIAQRVIRDLGADERAVAAYYRRRGAEFRPLPPVNQTALAPMPASSTAARSCGTPPHPGTPNG